MSRNTKTLKSQKFISKNEKKVSCCLSPSKWTDTKFEICGQKRKSGGFNIKQVPADTLSLEKANLKLLLELPSKRNQHKQVLISSQGVLEMATKMYRSKKQREPSRISLKAKHQVQKLIQMCFSGLQLFLHMPL